MAEPAGAVLLTSTVGALVVAPAGVPLSAEEQETKPTATTAAITILPPVRMAPQRRRRVP